jgi:hydrogenase-4 component E
MSGLLGPLNDLAGGLFLLNAFAMVATRQVRGCLRFFIWQSLCLVASAALIGGITGTAELFVVAAINLLTKPIIIPILLRRSVPQDIQTRREIVQVLTIPSALLSSLLIAVFSYFAGRILLSAAAPLVPAANVPIGIAGLLLGAFTIAVRREAVPQLFGLMAMENGAFYAGMAFSPDLPVIAEVAAAFDALIIVLLVGILTRAIHERVGTTEVSSLTTLKEEPRS